MEIRELNMALKEMARKAGCCNEWLDAWRLDDSIEANISRFKRGLDFTTSNPSWITTEFIKENFPLDVLHESNIYIDEDVDVNGMSGDYVFLGHCTGKARFGGFSVCGVYLLGDSELNIVSEDSSRVFVSMYERSECEVTENFGSKMRLYDRRSK